MKFLGSICLKTKFILNFFANAQPSPIKFEQKTIYLLENLQTILNLICDSGDSENNILAKLDPLKIIELLINHGHIRTIGGKFGTAFEFNQEFESNYELFSIQNSLQFIQDEEFVNLHYCLNDCLKYEQFQKAALTLLINQNDIPIFSHIFDALTQKNKKNIASSSDFTNSTMSMSLMNKENLLPKKFFSSFFESISGNSVKNKNESFRIAPPRKVMINLKFLLLHIYIKITL